MSILEYISSFFVISGIMIAIYIAIDINKNPQSMKIMNVVWILTGLWGSYLALYAYKTIGSENKKTNGTKDNMDNMSMGNMSMDNMTMGNMSMGNMNKINQHSKMDMPMNTSHWKSVTLSALHCGSGCTLADIIGELITYAYPIIIATSSIIGAWVFDSFLALIIGVFFQFFAIREMANISIKQAIIKAFKADFLSLLSWQIGMYGWMAIVYFIIFKDGSLDKLSFSFWFMMQIAMLCGFIVAYPVNLLLIKFKIKSAM